MLYHDEPWPGDARDMPAQPCRAEAPLWGPHSSGAVCAPVDMRRGLSRNPVAWVAAPPAPPGEGAQAAPERGSGARTEGRRRVCPRRLHRASAEAGRPRPVSRAPSCALHSCSPCGSGPRKAGNAGKGRESARTVRFRRVWLRRGRGVNANKLVFLGAGARLPCVSQHSDGSAPPPSSRRLLAALPGRRAPWPGLPGCPPCSARRLRLPSPWTGSPRHAPGAQSRLRPRGELARWALPRPFPATALAPSVHSQTVIPAAGHRHAQAGPHSCLGVPWARVGTVLGSDRQAEGVPSTGTCRGQSRAGGWGSSLVQLLTWEKRSL